jgi:WD40 repeat protein
VRAVHDAGARAAAEQQRVRVRTPRASPRASCHARLTSAWLRARRADTLAFANGRSVVLLNVNTQHAELFNEHTAQCTAARFAPTGNCILSGDASGCVRVWARGGTTQLQVQALAGEVNDLQLTGDTIKTLFVAGAGRGRLLAAFNADTGAALGNLTGVARPANTLDVSDDGLRVVCGDDGGALSVHDASVPFKNRFSLQDQSGGRAVNCVRFAPGGCGLFASARKQFRLDSLPRSRCAPGAPPSAWLVGKTRCCTRATELRPPSWWVTPAPCIAAPGGMMLRS